MALESFNRQLLAEHQALKKKIDALKPSKPLNAGKLSCRGWMSMDCGSVFFHFARTPCSA
jgi:hypothetical protein